MRSPTPKPPHPGALIRTVRRLAKAGEIAFTSHALDERMDEREISVSDVVEVLLHGEIEGAIEPGKRAGEWRCLVVGDLTWTSRDAGVVTVVVREQRLIVVTVEWMDP